MGVTVRWSIQTGVYRKWVRGRVRTADGREHTLELTLMVEDPPQAEATMRQMILDEFVERGLVPAAAVR